MIKFENTQTLGWEHAIRGMRNPMNSWNKSDSGMVADCEHCKYMQDGECTAKYSAGYEFNTDECYNFTIGPNDLDLMKRLRKAGTDHRKYMRMITVYVDITAPLYWWKEFDTYKVGTVVNSCSTMHKIHSKEFTIDDFSHEHLDSVSRNMFGQGDGTKFFCSFEDMLYIWIEALNEARKLYLETKDKKYWWQMIQLLPSSYNQKRTVMLNYEVLNNIYKSKKNHKLDEWSENIIEVDGIEFTNKWLNDEMYIGFCDWIKTLPYAEELITGGKNI